MPEENVPQSGVVPQLINVIVCDSFSIDPASQKKSLLGLWDRLIAAKYPTSRPLTVFAKVVNGLGHYNLQVQFVRVQDDDVLAQAEGETELDSRDESTEMLVPFPPLHFPTEGAYEIRIKANETVIGAAKITAVTRQEGGG